MDLWPLLRGEPNILKLTNRLHPNQNQLKRLGTQFHPTLIIPPSLKTLEQLVSSLKEVEASAEENCSLSSISSSEDSSYTEPLFGGDIIHQMEEMQHPEEEKLRICDAMDTPQGIGIDANDEVNVTNVQYNEFLDWLKDTPNHELFIRVKKFVSSINAILPQTSPSERETQSETLNLSMRSFVQESLANIPLTEEQRALYPSFLLKLIHILCHDQMVQCLPSTKSRKEDFFLERCRALSSVITFENLGHDNRHTVAQYREFWDCAIEQLSVMSTYRSVADKVTCLRNAVNILTRLLETIFSVVGADELMDGLCIIVCRAQVPRLKSQLELMDFYYEPSDSYRGVFESIKLRVRGIITFIKHCKYQDFTKLSLEAWEAAMGKEGTELQRVRAREELSSDDQPEDESEETPETEEAESVATSVQSKVSQKAIRSLFGKKTKKIIDGKWMECLDPMPVYTSDMKMNEESVVKWKKQRYRFYKEKPQTEKEQEELLEEYRNVIRTVENLLYLVQK
ncbi:hypothetical protein WA588_004117 [Blastocystis sp. NMH]